MFSSGLNKLTIPLFVPAANNPGTKFEKLMANPSSGNKN